eukprot:SAG31_NODE_222_length_19895_cov_34.907626_16_plen_107_part_00
MKRLPIIHSQGAVETSRKVPYKKIVVSWIAAVALVGGCVLWVLEHNSPAFRELDSLGFLLDCCFVALNGVTATGLATVDITRMSGSAQFVILLTMQLGLVPLMNVL